MNLKKILDNYYQKLLKVNGIYISDRMTKSDMEEFYKDIWAVGIPLEDINEILETIDKYEKEGDSTNLLKNR